MPLAFEASTRSASSSPRPFRVGLLLAGFALCGLLGGCATSYTSAELAAVRPPSLAAKLQRGQRLSLEEVIALQRNPGGASLAVRHLEKTGINSPVTRGDVNRLRQANVDPQVIRALMRQSKRLDTGSRENEFSFGMAF